MVELLLDAGNVGTAISCRFQLIGDIGVDANEGRGRLVESGALRLPFLEVRRNFRVAAEVVNVFQLALGRL